MTDILDMLETQCKCANYPQLAVGCPACQARAALVERDYEIGELSKALNADETTINELIVALNFYADPQFYQALITAAMRIGGDDLGEAETLPILWDDRGAVARAAIEKAKSR